MLGRACFLLMVLSVGAQHRSHSRKRERVNDSFESLFEVYEPSFLSGVWPKISNGMHLSLEQACWDHVAELLRDFSDGRAWAYRAVDASGRYKSGLFAGSRFWLGSKEECLQLDEKFQEETDNETQALLRNHDYINTVLRRQRYFDAELNEWRWMVQPDELVARLAAADARPPFSLVYSTLQLQLNLTRITMLQSHNIVMGVCLPKSCSPDDVQSIINFSIMLTDNLKNNRTVPRTVKIISSRRIEEFQIAHDTGAILLITITAGLVLLATIATLVDLDLMKCIRYKKQSMSFDLPTYNSSETKLVDELKRKHAEIRCVDDILAENSNLDLVSTSKISRSPTAHPVTLDVVNIGAMSGSCLRCGKYKRQCPNSKPVDSSASCPRLKYSSFASLSTEDRRKNNFFCRLLLCFSVCHCWKRIFNKNTANKDLSLIHVMRIVATLWVVFVHVAVIVGYTSDNAGDTRINNHDGMYYILASGTIAFDTLFFVSGLFSAHHFFYLKSRYSVEQLVSFDGTCGDFMQFICTVTNRIIRVVPSYAYTVILSGVVARAVRSTAALALPDADHVSCGQYWWRNLLYISNMYPSHEQCLQISWYLSTETQLHALGAAACAACAAGARARLVVLVAAAFALSSTAADVSGALLDYDTQYKDTYSLYDAVVERGWARVAPYFVGLFAGWLVHVLHGRLKLTKLLSFLLWGASLPLLCAAAALPSVKPAWLAAWLHLAWPCALLWPVLAACTYYAAFFRRLSGGACAALSRLSYSVLLLHEPVARALLLAADTALCDHKACVWMYWAGVSSATLLLALLLALLLEMPSCGLFRRLSDCAST